MNYHIIPQDKFFNAYIEDIYKLHKENNNVFWVRGNKGDSVFFTTFRDVTYIGYESDSIIERLKNIQPNDKIIISWYDVFIGECILKSKIKNHIYSYLMGGDFYNDPPDYHNYWLYDSSTIKIINKNRRPKIHLHLRPKNWYKYIDEFKTILYHKKNINKAYTRKLETISRIDYLITGANNDAEVSLIKKLYPSFKGEYINGSYDQNYDLAKNIEPNLTIPKGKTINILLGNSADPTNNHIDACKFLSNNIKVDYNISCPLSYGDKNYSIVFQKWAKKHLKSSFNPILDYMNRNDYIKLLNNMDIVVMYHNRQQAMGNIIISLTLGKPVFLKSQNPMLQMLKKIGIPYVYNISEWDKINLYDVCIDALYKREKCISIIKQYYSEQSRLNNLSKIIE